MEKIFLYIKTHNKTGLKYFGKTVQDPYVYKGSGNIWVNHIKKYGYDVTTEIVGIFTNKEECKKFAIDFSIKNNIVESKEWANLVIESLDGGVEPGILGNAAYRKKWNEDESFRNKQITILRENAKKNIKYLSDNRYDWTGKKHKEESKNKIGLKNSVHQKGEKNSCFGLMWITNGIDSTRIEKSDKIPSGWKKGRINATKKGIKTVKI
jgi:hypothetical protein